MSQKETEFLELVKEISLYTEGAALLEWDSQTGMPKSSTLYRAELSSFLSGQAFKKNIGPEMTEFMQYFGSHPDELTEFGTKVFSKVKENFDLNQNIPADEYQAYTKLVSESDNAWRRAREAKDFSVFAPYLENIISTLKSFIPYWQKNEATPYDVLLNQYEHDMTVAILDPLFQQVRDGIMAIRQEVEQHGTAPRTDFLSRHVPRAQQEKFVREVVTRIGYDFKRGRLDDTVHPFMLKINSDDVRLTTRWVEDDFSMAVFGTIHEAGHGMYEQDINPEFAYTPLNEGASMGIHESQSLFNELIIGSNENFWKKQYPLFQECTEGTFDDIDVDTFYKGLKHTTASLIRIEADSLTYPLHVIIRYEIEKMIFNEEVAVEDLPQIWSDKYEEYLGIRPENDLVGVLQDVHWSGGMMGYFPSYALGYMYAAQFYTKMTQEIPVNDILLSDDYSKIKEWLRVNIHQYGASKKPSEIVKDVTGETLNAKYLLDYLKQLYFNVYEIKM